MTSYRKLRASTLLKKHDHETTRVNLHIEHSVFLLLNILYNRCTVYILSQPLHGLPFWGLSLHLQRTESILVDEICIAFGQ